MGCFDSTCCLSGLPIKENDKIKIALITESNSSLKTIDYGIYPATTFKFLIPLFSGIYNDYGNIDWSSLNPKELPIMNMFLDMLKDAFKSNIKDIDVNNLSNQDMWANISYNHLDLDPNKERREEIEKWEKAGKPKESEPIPWYEYKEKLPYHSNEKTNVYVWICHDWAFNYVMKMHNKLSEECEEELDFLLITQSIADAMALEKFPKNEDGSWKDEAISEVFRITNKDLRRVFDDQGAFNFFIRKIMIKLDKISPSAYKLFSDNKKQFRKMMKETLLISKNMRLIRKIISPVISCGMQHDNYQYLSPWMNIVNDKVQKLKKDRDDDYGC